MPELPDVALYVEALRTRVVGRRLDRIHLISPFVLRSVEPALDTVTFLIVRDVTRLGKRLVLAFDALVDQELFLVLHLMIAGRLRWREHGQKPGVAPRMILASFEFENGVLFFTEASSTKRASMQLVAGQAALQALDPGGIEPLETTEDAFRAVLTRDNRIVKRVLTDPQLVSGIGNAYSDEILHAARLSPVKLTESLSAAEIERLYRAMRDTLSTWIERLRADVQGAFP